MNLNNINLQIINTLIEYIIAPEDQHLSDNRWSISTDNDPYSNTGWNARIRLSTSWQLDKDNTEGTNFFVRVGVKLEEVNIIKR